MDTRAYIRDNYDLLLRRAKTLKNFDEDVFQDTMLYLIINSERFTEETIYNYIIHALKINFVRELKYARHRTTAEVPETAYEDDSIDGTLIETLVSERFGKDLSDCYTLYANGYSVSELKSSYPHIKNLRGKIKTIESYIRDIMK